MVNEEHHKKIEDSIACLKPLLPKGARLLFECLVEPDEDAVSFSECYLLVTPETDDTKLFVVKDALRLHINLVMNPLERVRALSNWLTNFAKEPHYKICDSVEEKILDGDDETKILNALTDVPNKFLFDHLNVFPVADHYTKISSHDELAKHFL